MMMGSLSAVGLDFNPRRSRLSVEIGGAATRFQDPPGLPIRVSVPELARSAICPSTLQPLSACSCVLTLMYSPTFRISSFLAPAS